MSMTARAALSSSLLRPGNPSISFPLSISTSSSSSPSPSTPPTAPATAAPVSSSRPFSISLPLSSIIIPPRRPTAARQAVLGHASPATQTASFSAGAARFKEIRRGGMGFKRDKDQKKTSKLMGKPPAIGERKAYRKTIVLSNNSALPVRNLLPVTTTSMIDGDAGLAVPGEDDPLDDGIDFPELGRLRRTREEYGEGEGGEGEGERLPPPDSPDNVAAGRMLAIPVKLQDRLRSVSAFKASQTWPMFYQPAMLVRDETVELLRQMRDAVAKRDTLRMVITGDRLTGKSMLLLQALSYGLLNDWLVLNIPEAQELTNANTEYEALDNTNPTQYAQHAYAHNLLVNFAAANEEALKRIKTVHEHSELASAPGPGQHTLYDLASLSKPESGWTVFRCLWKEITTTGNGLPPILFCLDGLPHIMRDSAYRSAAFDIVHAHDLALPRLFVECLSQTVTSADSVLHGGAGNTGRAAASPAQKDPLRRFPNGAVVLAATQGNNGPRVTTMEAVLAMREAAQAGGDPDALADRFMRGYDARVEAALAGVPVMRVGPLARREARALMEYWAASGMFRARVDEAEVSERWALGGNGVVGEIERAALLNMRV